MYDYFQHFKTYGFKWEEKTLKFKYEIKLVSGKIEKKITLDKLPRKLLHLDESRVWNMKNTWVKKKSNNQRIAFLMYTKKTF